MDDLEIAAWLSRFKCFYFHEGEVRGPISLWKIREMVDFDELSPDVQVMREGKDFWKTFVETEREIGVYEDTPRIAPNLSLFYVRDETSPVVEGPVSSLGLLYYLRSGKLKKDVWVCVVGDEKWSQPALHL